MNTTPSTAAEYAAHLQARIKAECATEAPFGFVNTWDGSTADDLSEVLDADGIDADERDEYDADNLPGHWEKGAGYDYLQNVLDIRYVVASDRSYRDAEIYIGLGGPNVWIHTATRTLEVWWGFEHASAPLPSSFIDALNDAAAECWEMGA